MPGITVLLAHTGFLRAACCLEAAAILVLSAIPAVGSGVNAGTPAHVAAYGTFSLSVCLWLRAAGMRRPFPAGALGAALFGALIEVLQAFIPWRSCELADIAMNCLGAGAGMAAAFLIARLMYGSATRR